MRTTWCFNWIISLKHSKTRPHL